MEKVYDNKTEHKIKEEFQRLKDHCYLDHAGATLYSEVQIKNISHELCNNIFGNPHSLSLHSRYCTDVVEEIRNRILKHLHTNSSEYSLIFTSGATSAVRLLFENFDWACENETEEEYYDTQPCFQTVPNQRSAYVYTESNHTSIVGGREIATERGAQFFCLGYDESFSIFQKETPKNRKHYSCNSLFAYPAQCNFSGRKYPLEWIDKVHNGVLDSYQLPHGENRKSKWFVLLDSATYCSTNDLNLSVISPDFVCLSFYKIFGYPTGLGALIVRNSSAYVLKKTYFGGGTVDISLACQNFRKFRKILHERFEDGTIPFLSIIALNQGFKTFERLNLNMKIISGHVFSLAKYTYERMKTLRHWNGGKFVEFYADSDYTDISHQGGILNFNLLRSDGKYIGFMEVLHIANLHNIQLRTGCFCNSGACQRHLKQTDYDLKLHFEAGHICGDGVDIINGRPTGSIRISYGYMTTSENIDVFIRIMEESFLEVTPSLTYSAVTNNDIKVPIFKDFIDLIAKIETLALVPKCVNILKTDIETLERKIQLKKIWVYPIKSCGAMEVESWVLNNKGLECDREWMIVTEAGVCMTQKNEPRMSLILPKLDLNKRTITLTFRTANDSITIPIEAENFQSTKYDLCESKVCGDRILGYDCGDEIAEWISRHLNTTGLRLIRQSKEDRRKSKASKESKEEGQLSLTNQAQYLLINGRSIQWLQDRIEPGEDINMNTLVYRFRGNFLIDGANGFAENKWSRISIGSVNFKVDGPCGRCQMICIDQYTAEKSRKPLVALSRALNGQMRFGVYLSHLNVDANSKIHVGDKLIITDEFHS